MYVYMYVCTVYTGDNGYKTKTVPAGKSSEPSHHASVLSLLPPSPTQAGKVLGFTVTANSPPWF